MMISFPGKDFAGSAKLDLRFAERYQLVNDFFSGRSRAEFQNFSGRSGLVFQQVFGRRELDVQNFSGTSYASFQDFPSAQKLRESITNHD